MKRCAVTVLVGRLGMPVLVMDITQGAITLARVAPETMRQSRSMQQSASSVDDAPVGALGHTIGCVSVWGRSVDAPTKFFGGGLLQFLGIVTIQTLDLVVGPSKMHECTFYGVSRLGLCWIGHNFTGANIGDHANDGIVVQ